MSDEPELPTRGAEPPPPIELDPRPRVVRLNRRAVFVAGALATAVLLAAVFTLSGRSRQVAERREQAAGGRAEPSRFWEGEPDGVPRLPPAPAAELAADLASPADSREPASPQLEPAAVPALLESGASEPAQTLARAYTSRPVVFEGRADAPGAAVRRGGAAVPPPGGAAAVDATGVLRAARDLYPPEAGAEDGVVAQNLQHEKPEFLRSAAIDVGDEVLNHRVRPALSPYEVKAGSLVPAVLITQANSDLPGQLIAQVRENVFDTASGAHLLIPQGTRAIGVYDSLVAYGQERILVAWQRLIFPDGSSLNLGSMPGTDPAGAAGFATGSIATRSAPSAAQCC